MIRNILACLAFGCATLAAQTACLQDQYGNQYNFTIDEPQGFVYGTTTGGQSCQSATLPITGTFAKTANGLFFELTAANPTPDSCVAEYTLKGIYPNFDWYYSTGYTTPQPSKYVACGSAVAKDVTGKGALK